MTEVTNEQLARALESIAGESRTSDTIALLIAASRLRGSPSVSDSAGWIEWGGGECPVPEDQRVCVKLRVGTQEKGHRAGVYRWTHEGAPGDIVRYRLSE